MGQAASEDERFQRSGVSHVALVCRDMAKTVDFYTDILEMPLLKTVDLPGDGGQHFFFDCGAGDSVAFFWFPKTHEAAPGIASQPLDVRKDGFKSAHGSMNYLSLTIPAEKFDQTYQRLRAKGIKVELVDDKNGMSARDGLMRSMYLHDPDGIRIELSSYLRKPDAKDIRVDPRNARGERVKVANIG